MKFGCVLVPLPAVMRAAILEMAQKLPDEALAEDGRETEPHLTVLYGLPLDTHVSQVAALIEKSDHIGFRLGETRFFPAGPGAPYDVVYVSLEEDYPEAIYTMRRKLRESFNVTDTHAEYRPHITLGYVKPGEGMKYSGLRSTAGMRVVVDTVRYCTDSMASGTDIRLDPTSLFSAEPPTFFAAALDEVEHVRFRVSLPAVDATPAAGSIPGTFKGQPIQIYPAGRRRAIDGRVVELDEVTGPAAALAANAHGADLAITYDHENDVKRGSEAAGWMRDFVWIKGRGLFAMGVDWTKDAYDEITAKKWRYLSGDGPCKTSKLPDGSTLYVPVGLWAVSLVPKPALLGSMEGLRLSALTDSQAPTTPTIIPTPAKAGNHKEARVDRQALCAKYGLPADATDEQIFAAMDAKNIQLAASKKKCPGCDAMVTPEADGTCPECDASMTKAKPFKAGADPAAAAADVANDRSELLKLVDERVTASEKRKADEVRAEFAARDRKKAIETVLDEAEDDGRLTAADRAEWSPLLENTETFAAAAKRIKALPKSTPARKPGDRKDAYAERPDPGVAGKKGLSPELQAFQFGAGKAAEAFAGTDYAGLRDYMKALPIHDHEDSHDTRCECRGAFLSRAAAFAASRNIGVEDAIPMVALGEDSQFQRERHGVLLEGKQFGLRMRSGMKRKEVDLDLLKGIATHMRKSPIPYHLISKEMQDDAREATFATIEQMQAPGRYELGGGVGVEYIQGRAIGSELLPEVEGGADEKAWYLKFKTEKFERLLKVPTALNQTDHQIRTFNLEMAEVTLDVYDHQQWADRRLQRIAATLPLGLLAHMTQEAIDAEKLRKEDIQATFLLDPTKYASGHAPDALSGGNQFNDPASNPYGYITNLLAKVRKATLGTKIDTAGCGEDVFTALCSHPGLVGWAGGYLGTKASPAVPLPPEAIMAILGIPKWVIGGMFGSDTPGGASPTEIWGQALVLVATGRGRLRAPRFGVTVVSTGYPWIEPLNEKTRGAKGSDGIQIADAYKIAPMQNTAGILIRDAVAPLGA